MQCVSCKFENMPSSQNCARCGAVLMLTGDIDVQPPRASALSRGVASARWPLRRAIYAIGGALDTLCRRLPLPHIAPQNPITWGEYLRLVVPGWLQFYRGQRAEGAVFLGAYLVLLLFGLLLLGTQVGSLLVGLAIAVHIGSTTHVLVANFASVRERLSVTAIIGVLLFVLVYLPLGRLGQRIASPIRIVDRFASFQEGDVIWYSPLPEAQAGDLVVYRMPYQSFNQGNTVYQFDGDSIGRVLATEGQTVSADGAKVAVDNQPVDWTTTQMVTRLKGAPIRVPQGRIFVYADIGFGGMTRQQFLHISIVSPSSIRGSVLFRSYPIGRISRMNPRAI